MNAYTKSILALFAAGLSATVVGLTGDAIIDDVELLNILIAIVGSAAVFTAPNVPGARYTKFVLAVLTAVLTLAVNLVLDGITLSEWLQLALAGLAALGVYGVPNTPSTTTPAHAQ